MFEKYDFIEQVSLGENILRSETAAIVLIYSSRLSTTAAQ
jgi:16S rRNA U1498 N3-methylase RsmE